MSVCVLLCIAVVLLLDALAKFRPYRKQVNFIFRADRPANHSSDSASNIHWQQQQQHLPLATCPLPAASCQLRVASCQLPAASCPLMCESRKHKLAQRQQRNDAAAAAACGSNKNNSAIISFATMPSPWATHSHTCTHLHLVGCFGFAFLVFTAFDFYCYYFGVDVAAGVAAMYVTTARFLPLLQLMPLPTCHRHCHRNRLLRHKVRIANVLRSVWIRSWQATRRYASLAYLSAVPGRYQLVVAFN